MPCAKAQRQMFLSYFSNSAFGITILSALSAKDSAPSAVNCLTAEIDEKNRRVRRGFGSPRNADSLPGARFAFCVSLSGHI